MVIGLSHFDMHIRNQCKEQIVIQYLPLMGTVKQLLHMYNKYQHVEVRTHYMDSHSMHLTFIRDSLKPVLYLFILSLKWNVIFFPILPSKFFLNFQNFSDISLNKLLYIYYLIYLAVYAACIKICFRYMGKNSYIYSN